MTTGLASGCPNCGSPLHFGGPHSLAAVCGACRSAVARHGITLEQIGRVPDLVATDTRLCVGMMGNTSARTFTVLGRLQLARRDAAGEVYGAWNEWYVGYDDGSWGWLAEAQGRVYLTRPLAGQAPPRGFDELTPGASLTLPDAGRVVVDEVAEAAIVGAEGELPFRPALGATYRFADCSGENGVFLTLDYGTPGDAAVIYAGRSLGYAEAGLAAAAPPPGMSRGPEGEALNCPSCAAPLSLRSAETVCITCPSCGGLIEKQDRRAVLIAELGQRKPPAIPLGSRGPLDGSDAEVLGWVRRSCVVEGNRYFWEEYLLHGQAGYRWLVESAGHWSIVAPIPAARVQNIGHAAMCDGKRFVHFQTTTARYEAIQGEFYFRLQVGQALEVSDWIAPPHLLSVENDDTEINWSLGRSIDGKEVWRAFKLPGRPPLATGVGAAQPNPFAAAAQRLIRLTPVAVGLLLVVAFLVSRLLPGATVLSLDVPLSATPAALSSAPDTPTPADAPDSPVVLSEPFELPASHQAVRISAAAAALDQAWVGLDISLINDDTGESDTVGIELSWYHGVEGGESWSEGSSSNSATIGSARRGRYVLRVEPQVEQQARGYLPPRVTVTVERSPFLWAPFLLALVLIIAWPLAAMIGQRWFEVRRWRESDHESPAVAFGRFPGGELSSWSESDA